MWWVPLTGYAELLPGLLRVLSQDRPYRPITRGRLTGRQETAGRATVEQSTDS